MDREMTMSSHDTMATPQTLIATFCAAIHTDGLSMTKAAAAWSEVVAAASVQTSKLIQIFVKNVFKASIRGSLKLEMCQTHFERKVKLQTHEVGGAYVLLIILLRPDQEDLDPADDF
jgi:hypothetical protein